MGREVRRVPKDWRHPRDERGRFIPLHDDYRETAAEFDDKVKTEGLEAAIDWFGHKPEPADYMPDWPEEQRTHLMMYETTSEGTPISPAFATPEELAHWLADNGASAFADETATYEDWLACCKRGFACSASGTLGGELRSGVAAMAEDDRKRN